MMLRYLQEDSDDEFHSAFMAEMRRCCVGCFDQWMFVWSSQASWRRPPEAEHFGAFWAGDARVVQGDQHGKPKKLREKWKIENMNTWIPFLSFFALL